MKTSLQVEEFSRELGLRLRKARIRRNKTQKELAVMAGVSAKVIGRMEQGGLSVSLTRWLNICEILGVFDTWQEVLHIREDPFEQYDLEQRETTDLLKKRVRHSKK
ncbi:helix-turn-helix domain-containing protein [Desulfobacterota bacterium M19]